MQVAFIDASPKSAGSSSGRLLAYLRDPFGRNGVVRDIEIRQAPVPDSTLELLRKCSIWIFSCPLYFDSLPGHLTAVLRQIEQAGIPQPVRIGAIVNCGFYEGEHTEQALRIFANWAKRMQFRWCAGLGVGGGGAVEVMKPDSGPMTLIRSGVMELGSRVTAGAGGEISFAHVNLPRFLYKLAGEAAWRRMIRKNGGNPGDLGARPEV